MRYMYILLCIMSSFFAYKSIHAEENITQYAFFMPQNSLQENTTIKDFTPQTNNTIKKQNSTSKKVKKVIKRKIKKKKKSTSPLINKKRTFPVVKSKLKQITEKEPTKEAQTTTPEKAQKNKYTLGEITPIQQQKTKETQPTLKKKKQLSHIEQLYQTDIDDLLYNIPHPNLKDPTFKQLYSLYVMDLRTLNRRGSIPHNIKLEETLEKVNSIRRFEIPN